MLLEDSEANEKVDPENIIEVDSGTSSSYVSSDSSEFDDDTQSSSTKSTNFQEKPLNQSLGRLIQ